MKALLEKYQSKLLDNDLSYQARISTGNTKDKHSDDSIDDIPLNIGRYRNSKIRHEVINDLSTSPRSISPTRRPTRRRSNIALTERNDAPVRQISPTKAKTIGVHLGFQMNMIVITMKRVVDETNEEYKREFMRRLRIVAARVRSVEGFVGFTQRKQTNSKFHAFSTLLDLLGRSYEEIEVEEAESDEESPPRYQPIVCPLGASHPIPKIPPHVYDIGSGLNRFAAVGRISGVLLSIIRIQKISFFNSLIRLRFDKLYFIRHLS